MTSTLRMVLVSFESDMVRQPSRAGTAAHYWCEPVMRPAHICRNAPVTPQIR